MLPICSTSFGVDYKSQSAKGFASAEEEVLPPRWVTKSKFSISYSTNSLKKIHWIEDWNASRFIFGESDWSTLEELNLWPPLDWQPALYHWAKSGSERTIGFGHTAHKDTSLTRQRTATQHPVLRRKFVYSTALRIRPQQTSSLFIRKAFSSCKPVGLFQLTLGTSDRREEIKPAFQSSILPKGLNATLIRRGGRIHTNNTNGRILISVIRKFALKFVSFVSCSMSSGTGLFK